MSQLVRRELLKVLIDVALDAEDQADTGMTPALWNELRLTAVREGIGWPTCDESKAQGHYGPPKFGPGTARDWVVDVQLGPCFRPRWHGGQHAEESGVTW